MNYRGLRPATVLTIGWLSLTACAIARGLTFIGWIPAFYQADAVLGQSFCVAASVFGLISCLHVASLYPTHSPIRLGWLALTGNCFFSVIRHFFLIPPVAHNILGSQMLVYFLSQALQFPAMICLLFGLPAIWWGFYRLGLGFRVRALDWVAIACTAGFITLLSRNTLSHAHSGLGVLTILQQVNLGLLIAIAGVSLLLQGIATQMGGGKLAGVMRCVAVYAILRSLLTVLQGSPENDLFAWWLMFYAVPWIFAFGAADSCWLADTVTRDIRKQPYSDWDVSHLAE
jgi:hypothetical protein